MKYQIVGDYLQDSETLLAECFAKTDAFAFRKGYTRYGDFGGYNTLDIVQRDDNDDIVCVYQDY